MQKNRLLRKLKLILKFMTPETGKEIITIHILRYISRNKDNQAMKFGQLIEHKMANIFFKKSYRKCGGETSPRPLPKKSKLSISLDQLTIILYSLLL